MTGMAWRTTGDVAEFLAVAGDFLRAERDRNTVILTVTETLRVNPARHRSASTDPDSAPLFGWLTGADGPVAPVAGAFMHTPPFPLLLTAVPREAAAELAAITLAGRPLSGVNAAPDVAAAFAGAWRKRTGGSAAEQLRMRLYRLAELSWPDPAPDGAPRLATERDAALLTDWFTAFAREVHEMDEGQDQAVAVKDGLSYGGVTVWEAAGVPVSVAGRTRQVAGMVRIGPVYTPPRLRGHGYASAATAAASRAALAAGARQVLLFTDLANPVSNSIYQRIGFRPVEDRVVLAFANR